MSIRSRINQNPAVGQAVDRRQSYRGVRQGSDRRSTCRYAPIDTNAALGWSAKGAKVEIAAELENISVLGCLVKSNLAPGPKPGEPVWFRASGMASPDWIEGRVISVQKPFFRKYEIRIKFVSTMPFQAFKKLVYGASETEPEVIERPLHETDQWWR